MKANLTSLSQAIDAAFNKMHIEAPEVPEPMAVEAAATWASKSPSQILADINQVVRSITVESSLTQTKNYPKNYLPSQDLAAAFGKEKAAEIRARLRISEDDNFWVDLSDMRLHSFE